MNSELIMKTDILDLLFEKRNKAYGAYALRKFYNNRLIKSLGATTIAVIVFSAFTFLPDNTSGNDEIPVIETRLTHIAPSVKTPEIKPKPNRQSDVKPVSTIKLSPNITIVNKTDSADVLHNLDNNATGSVTTGVLTDAGTPPADIIGGNGGGTEPVKAQEPPVDVNRPIDNPETMPEYPGGMDALRKFLVKNLTNPRDLEDGELVTVKIRFVVGYDGKLQRFELAQDGGTEFNNEVIRVLKKMPAWIPGKAKGRNVAVYYIIPVKFIPAG